MGAQVVLIEFMRSRPFHVEAIGPHGREGYDFDWCKRDRQLYYHMSSAGCEAYLEHGGELPWWCRAGSEPSNLGKKVGETKRIRRWRRRWSPDSVFDRAIEGDGYHCRRCRDWLPDEDPCEHGPQY